MSQIVVLLALVLGLTSSAVAGSLHDAAHKGDLAAIEAALAQGAEMMRKATTARLPSSSRSWRVSRRRSSF